LNPIGSAVVRPPSQVLSKDKTTLLVGLSESIDCGKWFRLSLSCFAQVTEFLAKLDLLIVATPSATYIVRNGSTAS